MELSTGKAASEPSSRAAAAIRMPSFADGTHAHHHSVHSALASLRAMGIPAHRIVLRRTGRAAVPADTVVHQMPSAGAVLFPDSRVVLDIAGLGFCHALPVGMWDSGGETHAGARELLEPLDDPLEKLKHWFHEGAPLFRIAPDDPAACARWLWLFGVHAEDWPRSMWYRLASVVASLSQLSCSQEGCAFVLRTLLGLPVQTFTFRPTFSAMPEGALSTLGGEASRLGVDLLVGDAVEDEATLQIEIGPVHLTDYEYFNESEVGASLLRRTLEMVLPASTLYDVRWSVLDRKLAPRLGIKEQNARLGINTHMGLPMAGQQEQDWPQETTSWSNA